MKKWTNEDICRISFQVFAINMQRNREKIGVSFEELSNLTKMSSKYLKRIEAANVKNISIIKLFIIADALKTKLNKMFCI